MFLEVLKGEREAAKKIYDQEQEKIRDTVAFGRRSHGPPALYYPTKELHLTKFGKFLSLILIIMYINTDFIIHIHVLFCEVGLVYFYSEV